MAADGSDGTVRCLLVLNRDVTDRVLRAVSPQPVLGVRFVDAAADLETVESAAAGGAGATVVLHRAMYDASFSDDEEACRRLALLRQLSVRCVLTDPLDRVLPFADRGALCALVAKLAPTVLQPRWLVVRAGEDATAAAVGAGLRLPIVCKPLLACGPPRSHELVVALRLSALADVPLPALLQEYVPHGGRIFKVYCVGEHVHCEERPSLPDLLVGGEAGARFCSGGTATEGHGAATVGSGPHTTGIGSRGAGAGVSAWPNPCPDRTSATQAGTADAVGPLPPASVCFCTQGSMPTAAAFGAAAAQAVSGCWALRSESEGARETGPGGGREQGSTGPLAGAGRPPTAAAAACDRDGAMRLAASLARALGVGLLGVDVMVRADGAGGNATVGGKGDGCASQPRAGICCCAGGSGLAGCGCAGGCSGVLGCRDGTGGVGECGATECFSRLMVVDLNYMPNTSLRMADGGRALAQLVLDRHRAHREETPP